MNRRSSLMMALWIGFASVCLAGHTTTWTNWDWMAEGDGADAYLYRVNTAGDVNGDGYDDVICSAQYRSPAQAYVYHGSANGVSNTAAWTYSIAGGDLVTVGTGRGDVNGDGYDDVIIGDQKGTNQTAYVFHGTSTGLHAVADWSVSDVSQVANFSRASGMAGDVDKDGYDDVIVGHQGYDDGGSADIGRAYVYLGSAGGLAATAVWTNQGENAGDAFGSAVGHADVNGDGYNDVIVGAEGYSSSQGKVYCYHGTASGPTNTASWSYTVAGATRIGLDLSGVGDVNRDGYEDIVVGSQGTGFVFYGSSSGLSANPDWTVTPYQAGDRMGDYASAAGDMNGDGFDDVVVASTAYDLGVHENAGRIHVFWGSSTGLSTWARWTLAGQHDAVAASWAGASGLGAEVTSAGDVNGDGCADIIVGNFSYNSRRGRVYVYHGMPAGLCTRYQWWIEGNDNSAKVGTRWSAGNAGDVNKDGYDDVIVGSRGHGNDKGRVNLYYGTAAGASNSPSWVVDGENDNDTFGQTATGAGDVNGDGYPDLIVGAPALGRVYCFYGSSTGFNNTAASAEWKANGTQHALGFGYSLDAAGDVNKDGYDDVIVGDRQGTSAYVYHGSAGGLSPSAVWTSTVAGAQYAHCVGGAGDVNGDGYDDAIVADIQGASNPGGVIYVYHGSHTGLHAAADWSDTGADAGTYALGTHVGTAGDVNGDGYDDIIAGGQAGEAFAYYGGSGGIASGSPDWTGVAPYDFGATMGNAGDVNGDGYDDVIVGGGYMDPTFTDGGSASVFFGSSTGLSAKRGWFAEGLSANEFFGTLVDGVGDVNGDGHPDIIVGGEVYDGGNTDEGFVALFYGYGPPPPSTGSLFIVR